MAIYELNSEKIVQVPQTTFDGEGVKERADLQRLLRTNINVVAPDTLVIAEEFGQWQDSKRRIDLLALDQSANLVVIELKRTEDGGHMELQAIRYAAMVSTMTFEQVVAARAEFQARNAIDGDAAEAILSFLEWDEADDEQFAQNVRLVLVSANFSKELTTAVMWLNEHELDIRCVRLKPYSHQGCVLLDVQQVIPLPEAAEYQVQVKEKAQKEKRAKKGSSDFTRYDVSIRGVVHRAQWKRRAILLVVKALVHGGVSPERIVQLITWRSPHRVLRSVSGEVGSEEFIVQAAKDSASKNRAFDERRWFCDDDELLVFDGRTYALTNQWGNHWHEAIEKFAKAFPKYELSFVPTEVVT